MKDFRGLAAAALLSLPAPPAAAAELSRDQYAPEGDLYYSISKTTRLLFSVTRSPDRSNELDFGPAAELLLMPLLRDAVLGPNKARRRRLTLRAGLHFLRDGTGPDEQRGVLDLIPRETLAGLTVSDRSRADLRWVGGVSSWRYRNQVGLERSVRLGGLTATPAAHWEWYYDSRSAGWTRTSWDAGVAFPAGRWEVQPYFLRDRDNRAKPLYMNLIGLKVSLFL